jgi:hypothetical protein
MIKRAFMINYAKFRILNDDLDVVSIDATNGFEPEGEIELDEVIIVLGAMTLPCMFLKGEDLRF